MKRFHLSRRFFLLLWGAIFIVTSGVYYALSEDVLDFTRYDNYLKYSEQYCGSPTRNGEPAPLAFWRVPPASNRTNPYPPIEDLTLLDTALEGESSKVGAMIETVKNLHVDQMNQVYACGVISVKRRALGALTRQIGNDQTNAIHAQIKIANEKLDSLAKSRNCKSTLAVETNAEEARKQVLDTAMYSLCRYEYYLVYLRANAQQNARIFLTWSLRDNGTVSNLTLGQAGNILGDVVGRVESEMIRARRVNRLAFTSLLELEKTYGQHILLTYILGDYITLREDLQNIMQPLSQLFYKASNATNKFDR